MRRGLWIGNGLFACQARPDLSRQQESGPDVARCFELFGSGSGSVTRCQWQRHLPAATKFNKFKWATKCWPVRPYPLNSRPHCSPTEWFRGPRKRSTANTTLKGSIKQGWKVLQTFHFLHFSARRTHVQWACCLPCIAPGEATTNYEMAHLQVYSFMHAFVSRSGHTLVWL